MTTPEAAPDPDAGPGGAADPRAGGPDTEADPHAGGPDAEGDRLREAFAREAYDVTPSPVPLAALRRAGRRARRRRRAATVSGR